MKAQHRFGLALSWPRVTVVLLADVLILAVASHCPEAWQAHHHVAWWVGVGAATMVTLLSLVNYRGITMFSGFTAWLWDWSANPDAVLGAGSVSAIDYQRRFGQETVGVREHQGQLVTVIAIDGGDVDLFGRQRHRTLPAVVTLQSVVKGLRQFDIRLDAIDIVAVQVRGEGGAADVSALEEWGLEQRGAGQAGASEDGLAPIRRSTWLVLRMNPQRNVAAVVMRDSLASTLVAATERLVRDLDGHNCAARPLTVDELAEVDRAVLAGLEPARSRSGWRHLRHIHGYITSFWVTPSDISSHTLDQLWADHPEVWATVITMRLLAVKGQTQLSAWVRYHSDLPLTKQVWAGLNRLIGRQLAAVRASTLAPVFRPPLVVPSREFSPHEDLVLSLESLQESAMSGQAEQ